MVLVLAAILVAHRGTSRSLLAAGAILGLAALARQDLGAYGMIAVIVSSRSLRPLAGAVVILIPAAIVFLLLVPVSALYEQLIWYPLVGTRVFRALPAPSLTAVFDTAETWRWLLYWPPLAVIGLALARYWRRRSIPASYGALLILAVLCRLQTLGRADEIHSAYAIAPAMLLAGFALSGPHGRPHRFVLSVGASVAIALAALPLIVLGAPLDPYDVALRTAADIVRSETTPDEPIFVGEVRNQHAFMNPLIAYYFAERPPGVRDTMYNPGVTNTAATQSRMVADLQAARVRFLILDVRYADCFEPTNESRNPGPTILDQAIAKNYVVVADFGAVVVMGLRGAATTVVSPALWVDPAPPTSPTLSCAMTSAAP